MLLEAAVLAATLAALAGLERDLLGRLTAAPGRTERLTHVEELPPRLPTYSSWPDWVPDDLRGALAAGGEGGGDDAAEKDEFEVILESAGDKKINVIKEVRALTSLGLKEAKELVEAAPKAVLENANKETADKAKEALEGAGATVTVK